MSEPTSTISDADLQQIWTWNKSVPSKISRPVHEIIEEQAQKRPNEPAICAWNGSLTYAQLNELSNRLAHFLKQNGVGPGVVVPLFFEKSMWTPVSQLAVIKAGGACAALNASQTKDILAGIISTIQPTVVCCSSLHELLVSDISRCQMVVVNEATLNRLPEPTHALPWVDPTNMLYLVFTSGTTGKPKGVVISHANLSSAHHHQKFIHGFAQSSRVLDFASYAFDVAYTNLFFTLAFGACLFIPAEEVRSSLSLLEEYIVSNKINHADLTPSVVSAMSQSTLESLDLLIVGGEMLPVDQAQLWSSCTRLIQTYGPAECTITTTIVDINGDENVGYLGPTYGLNAWIVQDCENDSSSSESSLAPIGEIGELWLEGPLVGQGYFEDPGKTGVAFVDDPPWLLDGLLTGSGAPGRRGKLYRTGDLVHYNSDGTLTFVSRRDTQVKIRGQRVELSSVEESVRKCLFRIGLDSQVVVEAIKPVQSANKLLALFLKIDDSKGLYNDTTESRAVTAVRTLEEQLPSMLPGYEVPSVYIEIGTLPVTATGKVDRRKLRDVYEVYTVGQLAGLSPLYPHSDRRQPATEVEYSLAKLWAQVLRIDESEICATDSFLRIGGDSLSAMKLVGLARDQSSLLFTTADILKYPKLEDLARVAKPKSTGTIEKTIAPFSLLPSPNTISATQAAVAKQCQIQEIQIQDIFPCTPLQEGLIALTAKSPGNYVIHWVMDLCPTTDLLRLQRAWERVVKALPILRTRIANSPENGLVQVVVDEKITWTDSHDAYSSGDSLKYGPKSSLAEQQKEMGLGTPLVKYQARSTDDGDCFSIIIHHALYDGWSVPLIFEMLERAYSDEAYLPSTPSFQLFVRHVLDTGTEDAAQFWSDHLGETTAPVFPTLPSPEYEVQVNKSLSQHLAIQWPKLDATPSTMIWGAWGMVISQISGSKDVIFGVTLSGRQTEATVPGIDRMIGSTIATVPVRLLLDSSNGINDTLSGLQATAADLGRYEQTGLQNIRKYLRPEQRQACDFQSLVVVQPNFQDYLPCKDLFKQTIDEIEDEEQMVGSFDTYAINLICSLEDDGVKIDLNYDEEVISNLQASRLMSQLQHTLEELCASQNTRLNRKLGEIDTVVTEDLHQIWNWNKLVPTAVTQPIHERIAETVQRQPDAQAVCSWDGELTYRELDTLSTRLAALLMTAGVGARQNTIVPLFFEKTLWMPVAMLAVMKAGGASVAIDVNQPEERQLAVIQAVGSSVVLCSTASKPLAARVCNYSDGSTSNAGSDSNSDYGSELSSNFHLIVTDESLRQTAPTPILPVVQPSDVLYLIFTSGTTGKPKGVMVTHGNMSSAVYHQSQFYGYDSTARVFDFASYAFDAAWLNFVVGTVCGACICIPSDHDRQNDFAGSISKFRATHVDLTASVAKSLPRETIKNLKWLTLGGEAVQSQDAERWASDCTVIINMYGPSECSPSATIATIEDMRSFTGSIGRGYGLNTWITDPENFHSLLPIGCVGELLLEGPLVGPGYLNDEEKTEAAFVHNPKWLIRGNGKDTPGRSGRLYRTGDLARYNPDGTLTFMGRADSQVKINGQRVEPSGVEEVMRRNVPESLATSIVVEAIKPADSLKSMLVAFFNVGESQANSTEEDNAREKMLALSEIIRDNVSKQLPRYMVPSALLLKTEFPMTVTRKTDRRKLRDSVESMTAREIFALDPLQQDKQPLSTDAEHVMAELWSSVLNIPKKDVSASDSFLKMGGDSITAMRLVSQAPGYGLSFTVADVLKQPLLRDISVIAEHFPKTVNEKFTVEPFSLMGSEWDSNEDLSTASRLIGVDKSRVEDIFPCTSLQEGFLALAAKHSGDGDYIARYDLSLRRTTDLTLFKLAWDQVLQQLPILRTRIVYIPKHGLVQVVLADKPDWIDGDVVSTEASLAADMGLCMPLVRFALAKDQHSSSATFKLCISHALYDGWSLPLIFEALQREYQSLGGRASPGPQVEFPAQFPPFQKFVKHVLDIEPVKVKQFWTEYFDGLVAPTFPSLANMPPGYQVRPNKSTARYVDIDWKKLHTNATASTVLLGAWSLVTMQYTNSADVVFGVTLSGRQAPVPQIELIPGPTIATVPFRAQIQPMNTAMQFLSTLQDQAIDVTQFEQTGLQQIAKISPECNQACEFQSIVVVQPDEDTQLGGDLFEESCGVEDESASLGSFDSYAINLICSLRDGGVELCINYDDRVFEQYQAESLTNQLEHILRQLTVPQNSSLTVAELCTPQADHLKQIWRWNEEVPVKMNKPVHDFFAEIATWEPSALAVDAWDGRLTYRELDWLSTQLAYKLIDLGVGRDVIVPLCFEKSVNMTICMMAVMKAGGASVTLDVVAQPEERLRVMVDTVQPIVAICSPAQEKLANRICDKNTAILVASKEIIEQTPAPGVSIALPKVDPESILYIVFTSGTTGKPKGATITHANFSSAIYHQRVPLARDTSSRVSDFASYAFDASWNNVLHTITNGGCLCVPSDAARTGDIAEHIESQKVNDIDITPSVASTLPLETLKKLKSMLVGGESLSSDYAAAWKDITRLKNVYGPAECTPTATVWDVGAEDTPPNCLGRGLGVNTWVVQDGPEPQLAPIGSIGELWLEGPLVGRGYYQDPEKTAAVFVNDPPWLLRGGPGFSGRRGRLYKTGDLVSYNSNGTITFISRKDAQVKIRGQRIELEDVENNARRCLHDHPEVQIIAEAAKPQQSKNNILVLFLYSENNTHQNALAGGEMIDENGDESLVALLEKEMPALVPSYAVPSIYIHVHKLPLGPTGKADRRKLREIVSSFTPEDLGRFVPSRLPVRAPTTFIGKQLQRLWASSLNVSPETIGCDDDFMRIGGDSIKVMILVREIKQKFSVNLSVDRFLQNKTLEALTDEVSRLQSGEDRPEVDVEPVIKDVQGLLEGLQSVPYCIPTNTHAFPSRVFLTGANGYLGTSILHQLLCNSAVEKVFVLIRAQSVEKGWQRIIEAAVRAKWWRETFRERICIWLGDLSRPCLGLDPVRWGRIAGSNDRSRCIEAIVHNGAAVDWLGTYESLRDVNLGSTYELLRAARSSPFLKRFIFMSTSPDLDLEHDVCSEEAFRNELALSSGYAQSKMMAEHMLLQATSQQAVFRDRICVLKPGFIIGDAPRGIANVDDYVWRIVAGAVTVGAFPVESADTWIWLGTCAGIASIAEENLASNGWHNPLTRGITSGLDPVSFWNAVNRALPTPLKATSVTQWRDRLQTKVQKLGPQHPTFAVQAFLDEDDEAILGGARTEDNADLNKMQMLEVEAAVTCNVKYLLDAGYFSEAGPSIATNATFTRTKATQM